MVIVVMGVAGSGKTTVAREVAQRLGWTFLEADDLHTQEAKRSMREGTPLTASERDDWIRRVVGVARESRPVVLACSALRRRHRDELRTIGDVEFDYLRVPPAELEHRLAVRSDHFFAPELLADQLDTLQEPEGEDVVTLDGTLPVDELVDRIVSPQSGPGCAPRVGSSGP